MIFHDFYVKQLLYMYIYEVKWQRLLWLFCSLSLSATKKELLKSDHICQSYHRNRSGFVLFGVHRYSVYMDGLFCISASGWIGTIIVSVVQ